MSTEPNRSSAPTPAELAEANTRQNAAIQEAVAAVFAQFMPLLEKLAITPEKLREANKPYVDPAKLARDERETRLWRQDIEDQRKNLQQAQDNCLHQDDNGRSSLQLVHNYPDRQPRGLCVKCQCLVHPKEWRIGAPTKESPRGVAFLVEPHKNYQTVLQLQSRG